MSRYGGEKVLVIARELFDELGAFEGFQPVTQHWLDTVLDPRHNRFLDRELAEDDPGFKQIIPYALFRHEQRFLHYVRGKGSGEKRLASKGSLGIGGHVNESDFHAAGSLGKALYIEGVEREIREELEIASLFRQSVVGLINDDQSDVGRVHLGVVHLFDLDEPAVRSREENITAIEFLDAAELAGRAGKLETWSSLLLPHLNALCPSDGLTLQA